MEIVSRKVAKGAPLVGVADMLRASTSSAELTFIILHRPSNVEVSELATTELIAQCPMAGDVNVFFSDWQDDEDEEGDQGASKTVASTQRRYKGELEIMIAGEEPVDRSSTVEQTNSRDPSLLTLTCHSFVVRFESSETSSSFRSSHPSAMVHYIFSYPHTI